ncbi:hypothetical protein Tco_0912705 [Tanacetum coccineum]
MVTGIHGALTEWRYYYEGGLDGGLRGTQVWIGSGDIGGGTVVRNSLHYQDLEWYEALEDSELKDKALRNKSIMEGLISDDESSNYCWRRWKSHEITYHDHDEIEHENETHDERQELCEAGGDRTTGNADI